MTLKFRAEYGEPIIVRVEHDGAKYIIRLNVQVLSVRPSGDTNPVDGLPVFNVQAAPVMTVEADSQS